MIKLIFDECGNFVGMCKSYFISMEIFMGMEKIVVVMWVFFFVGHERFLGFFFFFFFFDMGFLAWKIFLVRHEFFCWTWDFWHRIFWNEYFGTWCFMDISMIG